MISPVLLTHFLLLSHIPCGITTVFYLCGLILYNNSAMQLPAFTIFSCLALCTAGRL